MRLCQKKHPRFAGSFPWSWLFSLAVAGGIFANLPKGEDDARDVAQPPAPVEKENAPRWLADPDAAGQIDRVYKRAVVRLKALRKRYTDEFNYEEEQKIMREKVRQISDPHERLRIMREFTDASRAAQKKADATWTKEERLEERRCVQLIKIPENWKLAERIAKHPVFAERAHTIAGRLIEWTKTRDELSHDDFMSSLQGLRQDLYALNREFEKHEVEHGRFRNP